MAVFTALTVATAAGIHNTGMAIMRPVAVVSSTLVTAYAAASVMAFAKYHVRPKEALMQTGALDPNSVIMLMVVGLLAAILVPVAIDQFVAVDTSSWSTTTQTIWNNLPTILAVALLIGFVSFFVVRRGGFGRR